MGPSVTQGLLRPGPGKSDQCTGLNVEMMITSKGVQQTVRNNLRWMSEKYVGSFFWTVFKGRSYRGLILKVEWSAVRGYAVRVRYNDGYWEMVPVRSLKKRDKLQEEMNFTQQKSMRIERCSGFQVGEQVVLDDIKQSAMFGPVCELENGSEEHKLRCEVMDLHERFVGRAFVKFFDVRGVQEQFLGTVKEVWWSMEQKTFYAQVNYEDGDLEDIPVEELINLLTEETCKKATDELQWPVFEASENDLKLLWAHHVASLQVAHNESAISNEAVGDASELLLQECVEPEQEVSFGKSIPAICSAEDCSKLSIHIPCCRTVFVCCSNFLICFILLMKCTEQWFLFGKESPWSVCSGNLNLRGRMELCSVFKFQFLQPSNQQINNITPLTPTNEQDNFPTAPYPSNYEVKQTIPQLLHQNFIFLMSSAAKVFLFYAVIYLAMSLRGSMIFSVP